jgi:Rad3-related DNA helicase
MTPQDLGFPESYSEFRPAQSEAVEFCLTSERRVTGIGAPTGVGKSGIAFSLAKVLGGRTVILTANLGLERQYTNCFGQAVANIRGRANYRCWEGGSCEDGARMSCQAKGNCLYTQALKAAQQAPIVVTNYAYWLAVNSKGRGLGQFDTLICDESCQAVEWLSRALDFHIGERECREAKVVLTGPPGEAIDEWQGWASAVQCGAEAALLIAKARALVAPSHARDRLAMAARKAESLVDRAARLASISQDNWVVTRNDGTDDGRIWRFECVWPGQYRERLLQGIERVVLMSATLRPKTMALLGIARDRYEFQEWGRQFPAANGPVIWWPCGQWGPDGKLTPLRVNHRMNEHDEGLWLGHIAAILNARSDRRGLIHSKSYARARRIADSIGKGHWLKLNGAADPESGNAREAFDAFLRGPDNAVLCSPSFSMGWDFAGRAAEYQIIAKIPIPDTRSKVMQARLDKDRGYGDYLAAQELVQACGRIVRSPDDRGETVIVDDSWQWFGYKAREHFPRWFKVRMEKELPRPLEKL